MFNIKARVYIKYSYEDDYGKLRNMIFVLLFSMNCLIGRKCSFYFSIVFTLKFSAYKQSHFSNSQIILAWKNISTEVSPNINKNSCGLFDWIALLWNNQSLSFKLARFLPSESAFHQRRVCLLVGN